MELTAELKTFLNQKAQEYFNTQKFTIQNGKTGAKVEYTPMNACNAMLPVNVTAQTTLNGFLHFLFREDKFNALMKDLKLPPSES